MDYYFTTAGIQVNRLRIIIALLSICLSSTVYSSQLIEQQYIKLNAAGLFFNKPTGSIAFLPKVGDELYLDKVRTHFLLPSSGFYKLPKKGNYFFRVNHRGETEESSYLAVSAYIIYPSAFGHRNQLNLTRNKANWQAGAKERKLQTVNIGPGSPDLTINEFLSVHAPNKSVKEADDLLKFTWHAAVEGGSPYSWDYKSRWHQSKPPLLDSFLQKLAISNKDHQAALTAHLLHFTLSKNPSKTLDFWFNADYAVGAYVRVFSPASPVFGKEFYFMFE
jgi:hypothetical protein